MNEKIRVLFLAANPIDAGRIRLDEEAREIRETLASGKHGDTFELIPNFTTRPNDLQRVLLQHQPHIVHFSGHGRGPQGILLQDDSGRSKLVTLKAISSLFRLLKDNVRVVIFNACYSKPQAGTFSEMIDYTIGTSSKIGDRAAIVFAASFYRALAFGLSVRDGFELAKNELALNAIRNTGSPKLFIRDGVDPSTPFVTQIVDSTHKEAATPPPSLNRIKNTVERLSEGVATPSDARTIQHALTVGSIVLERTGELPSGSSKKESKPRGRRASSSVRHKREGTRIGTKIDLRVEKPGGKSKAEGSKKKTRGSHKDTGRRGYPNSYNFVKLDFKSRSGTIYFRGYSDNRGGFWTEDNQLYRNLSNGMHHFTLRL